MNKTFRNTMVYYRVENINFTYFHTAVKYCDKNGLPYDNIKTIETND